MIRQFILALILGLTLAGRGCSTRPTKPPKKDYGHGKTWLCRPGRQDACAVDLTTTVVAASGKLPRETWTSNPNAPIDCFYVYPTVSNDPTPNITYASFWATAPPPANSRFGKVAGEGMVSSCTNPAALSGGSGELHSYLSSGGRGNGSSLEPNPWVTPPQPINTPFVSVPGTLTAERVSNDKGTYLAITVHGDPAGARTQDIVGDVVVGGQVFADWGLHLIDVNLAMGNLIDIVGQQSKAYLAAQKKE